MGCQDGLNIYDTIFSDYDEDYVSSHYKPLTKEQQDFLSSLGL